MPAHAVLILSHLSLLSASPSICQLWVASGTQVRVWLPWGARGLSLTEEVGGSSAKGPQAPTPAGPVAASVRVPRVCRVSVGQAKALCLVSGHHLGCVGLLNCVSVCPQMCARQYALLLLWGRWQVGSLAWGGSWTWIWARLGPPGVTEKELAPAPRKMGRVMGPLPTPTYLPGGLTLGGGGTLGARAHPHPEIGSPQHFCSLRL